MSPFLPVLLLAAAPVLPKDAAIEDSNLPPHDIPIGNVLVVFTDGHKEKWTHHGRATIPHVSSNGLVGWAIVTGHNFRGDTVDSVLRVCWPDGHYRDYRPSNFPFIEEWNFSEDGSSLYIKSRAAHGPADYDEYDLKSGKLIEHAHGKFGKDLPVWAQPFSD